MTKKRGKTLKDGLSQADCVILSPPRHNTSIILLTQEGVRNINENVFIDFIHMEQCIFTRENGDHRRH
jgi:hypothetical protein